MISSTAPAPPRRALLLGLATGLSVAAAIAILALLTHSFDRADARLIGTSLAFSVFSALAAAGTRARRELKLAPLGVLTTGAAALSFALLELAIWVQSTSWAWRAFGVVAVLTLAASHTSLVLSARRTTDSALITNLTVISVLTALVDATLAAIAIIGLVHDVTSTEIRLAAILVISMLLSTALPPILRRATPPPGTPGSGRALATPQSFAVPAELRDIADRLELIAPSAGGLADDIQQQAGRIRRLADRPARF